MTDEEKIKECEEDIRRMRLECQRLEREEKYPEALAMLHAIDAKQAHKELLQNIRRHTHKADTHKVPLNIQTLLRS